MHASSLRKLVGLLITAERRSQRTGYLLENVSLVSGACVQLDRHHIEQPHSRLVTVLYGGAAHWLSFSDSTSAMATSEFACSLLPPVSRCAYQRLPDFVTRVVEVKPDTRTARLASGLRADVIVF